MIRFLIIAFMFCLYAHGLMTGFQIASRGWTKGKETEVGVNKKDMMRILLMLSCAIFVACCWKL